MKKPSVFGSLCVACAIAVVLLALHLREGGGNGAASSITHEEELRSLNGLPPFDRPQNERPKPRKPTLETIKDDGDNEFTPEEKALAERIERALDDENFELAVACAEEAQRCGVAEIRQSMVDTLGWFGEKALPELMPFLADADEDVRESAMSEWTAALSTIEDEESKIGVVELAMGVLKEDDALEEISNEYIGVDEKLAVESLARIIDGNGSKEGIEKAKEIYEFVTGNEWAGADEAARWIAEDYEPSEAE